MTDLQRPAAELRGMLQFAGRRIAERFSGKQVTRKGADIHVAVYGSLLSGLGNQRMISSCPLVGTGMAPGIMFPMGGFPGAISSDVDFMKVEVYAVDCITLEGLDRLQGHPNWYRRQEVQVVLDSGQKTTAWLYYQPDKGQLRTVRPVENGDWKAYVISRDKLTRDLAAAGQFGRDHAGS